MSINDEQISAVPGVIENDSDHQNAMEQVTALARKGAEATVEELALLRLWTALVENYERIRWPKRRGISSPAELVAFLIQENRMKQTDLADIASQSNISAILRGKRPIGKRMAQKLATRFHVDAALFL